MGGWRDRGPDLPVLAAGMVGSRTGWREVPYVECPPDVGAIAAGVVPFESDCGRMHLVPGVMQGGSAPDMMRGEEMQIIGAIEREPWLAADALLVLPGTHSKWASIHDGRVTGFTTYLTGELFAMLRDHSIIGGLARDAAGGTDATRAAAFWRGIDAVRASNAAATRSTISPAFSWAKSCAASSPSTMVHSPRAYSWVTQRSAAATATHALRSASTVCVRSTKLRNTVFGGSRVPWVS